MEVRKEKNKNTNTYNILLIDKDVTFEMTFASNLDLYWHVQGKNWHRIDKEYGYYDFKITKENFRVYDLFNNLYESILHAHIFKAEPIEAFSSLKEYEEDIKWERENNKKLLSTHSYQSLVNNKVITWASDDAIDDENDPMFYIFPPSYVSIKKAGEDIWLEFKTKLIKNIHQTSTSIRFRTNGSYYGYFYIPFMELYHKFQKYEETNQIHIEEYLYLIRKKEQ